MELENVNGDTPFSPQRFCPDSTLCPHLDSPISFSSALCSPCASNRPFLAITYSTVLFPASSTKQFSEDAPAVAIEFKKEPMGLPSSKGFGYLDVNIGDEFGPDGCYVVLRKLGYGMYSTVWLARDKRLV